MWIYANPNPCRQEEPDCVVRAISVATGMTWDKVHNDLCDLSGLLCTMPSVNWLWGKYLTSIGFDRFILPDTCPDCMRVKRFCEAYPDGTFVAGTGSHAVAIIDGDYYDTWNSGDEVLTFFYKRRSQR